MHTTPILLQNVETTTTNTQTVQDLPKFQHKTDNPIPHLSYYLTAIVHVPFIKLSVFDP